MENFEKDYERRSELDHYEADGLNDENQIELSMQGRHEVDRRIE